MPSLAPTVTMMCSGAYSAEKRSAIYLEISSRRAGSPRLPVYWVYPRWMLLIAALRMCHGVMKSGSPTPREMASFISDTMSKNLRMPLGLRFFERSLTKLFMRVPKSSAPCPLPRP